MKIPSCPCGLLVIVLALAATFSLSAKTTVIEEKCISITNGVPEASSVSTNAPTGDSDDAADAKPRGHSASITINDDDDKDSSFSLDLKNNLIPLAGILASFGTPVLIIFFICYFRYRRRRENLDMVREYLNKGLPVPPQLLGDTGNGRYDPIAPLSQGRADVRKGIRVTFIGAGVTLALFIFDPRSTDWAWGLIPLLLGLGFLASGWVELRHDRKSDADRTFPPPPAGGSV